MVQSTPRRYRRRLSVSSLSFFLLVLGCSLTRFHVLADEGGVSVETVEEEIETTTPEEEIETTTQEEEIEEKEEVIEEAEEVRKKVEEVVEATKEVIEEAETNIEAQVTIPDDEEETESVIKKMVGTTSSKTTAVIDRIKNISKNDVKKLAAATVGAWGTAAGIGWFMQQK